MKERPLKPTWFSLCAMCYAKSEAGSFGPDYSLQHNILSLVEVGYSGQGKVHSHVQILRDSRIQSRPGGIEFMCIWLKAEC
jgi:hypothetical protein